MAMLLLKGFIVSLKPCLEKTKKTLETIPKSTLKIFPCIDSSNSDIMHCRKDIPVRVK